MNKTVLKIVFLGNMGSGKTAIIQRFVHHKFVSNYQATIGLDFSTKEMTISSRKVSLQIWDTAGQERFYTLGASYFRGADCCVLVFDTTDELSFSQLEYWRSQFLEKADPDIPEKFPFFILANKIDMRHRKVTTQKIKRWCQINNGIEFAEVSAKENSNINEAFLKITQKALEYSNLQNNVDSSNKINLHVLRPATKNSGSCCG